MKSSECAARNCNRGIGLFSHFADHVWCKIFSVVHAQCIQITVKTKVTRHCAPAHNYGLIAQFAEEPSKFLNIQDVAKVRFRLENGFISPNLL
jgi:hypothetical protein